VSREGCVVRGGVTLSGPMELCRYCRGAGWQRDSDEWTVVMCFMCNGERLSPIRHVHDCGIDGHSYGHGTQCHYCGAQ
jgi:hypothetical protein